MIRVLAHQMLMLLVSVFILTLLTFSLTLQFPENMVVVADHSLANASSLASHYGHYIEAILSGEWGVSQISGQSVLQEFYVHIPATFELSFMALLFSLLLGIPLGITAAENKNKWQDKFVVSTTLIGYSLPIFWWGMLLVLLFSLTLGLTPVAGRIGFEYDIIPITGLMLVDTLISDQPYRIEAFYSALQHLILPTIVLGTIPLAIFTRITRSAMIDALASDYIRTAKAKGLSYHRVIWVHALRNALIPIVTVIGLQISVLITGTLITESIFSWPGIGKWLLEAVYRRDLVTLHGGLLAIAVIVIVTNIIVEITTYLINPKLRQQR